jgi:hypothetical protein
MRDIYRDIGERQERGRKVDGEEKVSAGACYTSSYDWNYIDTHQVIILIRVGIVTVFAILPTQWIIQVVLSSLLLLSWRGS